MRRIQLAAVLAFVFGTPVSMGAQTTRVLDSGRCAIPLVRFPAPSGIDRMNVLPPGLAPYREKHAMPIVVPAPSCGKQNGEVQLATAPNAYVFIHPRGEYRRTVEYHAAPLPEVLTEH